MLGKAFQKESFSGVSCKVRHIHRTTFDITFCCLFFVEQKTFLNPSPQFFQDIGQKVCEGNINLPFWDQFFWHFLDILGRTGIKRIPISHHQNGNSETIIISLFSFPLSQPNLVA